MLSYNELYPIVQEHFVNHNNIERFNHSIRVAKMAVKLNQVHNLGLDLEKVKITALLHDYAKVESDEKLRKLVIAEFGKDSSLLNFKPIWHALVGDRVLEEQFGITDKEMLNAVKYHSTGRPGMNNLEKIIYLADYIEEGRTFKEAITIRKVALVDLDKALLLMTENSVKFIKSKGMEVYPLTLDTLEYLKRGKNVK